MNVLDSSRSRMNADDRSRLCIFIPPKSQSRSRPRRLLLIDMYISVGIAVGSDGNERAYVSLKQQRARNAK